MDTGASAVRGWLVFSLFFQEGPEGLQLRGCPVLILLLFFGREALEDLEALFRVGLR